MEFARFAENPRELARLEERFKRIITANKRDHIEGKRVLDLAASNGRWSCAAAEAGASQVVSVEGREARVQEAIKEAERLGIADRCRFLTGDMYDWLYENRNERFDTVLCLGVYYHVMDHYHLLKLMTRLQPNCIIIDSGFVRSFRLAVHVQTERTMLKKNALAGSETQLKELVGLVSLGMMNQMAWNCGYIVEPVVWDPEDVANRQSVKDYMAARRYTLRVLREPKLFVLDEKWQDRWRPALRALNPKYEQLLDGDKAHLVEDPWVQGAQLEQPFMPDERRLRRLSKMFTA